MFTNIEDEKQCGNICTRCDIYESTWSHSRQTSSLMGTVLVGLVYAHLAGKSRNEGQTVVEVFREQRLLLLRKKNYLFTAREKLSRLMDLLYSKYDRVVTFPRKVGIIFSTRKIRDVTVTLADSSTYIYLQFQLIFFSPYTMEHPHVQRL